MKRIGVCLIAVMCAVTCACPKDSPAGVSGRAVLAITDIIHTGADTVHQLEVNGTLTKTQQDTALHVMNAVNDLDIAYGSCVQRVYKGDNTPASYAACVSSFQAQLQDATFQQEIRVLDPASQQSMTNIVGSVGNLLSTTLTQLQSAKAPK